MQPSNPMLGHARTTMLGLLSGDTCPGYRGGGGRTGAPMWGPVLSDHHHPAASPTIINSQNPDESCPGIPRLTQ